MYAQKLQIDRRFLIIHGEQRVFFFFFYPILTLVIESFLLSASSCTIFTYLKTKKKGEKEKEEAKIEITLVGYSNKYIFAWHLFKSV